MLLVHPAGWCRHMRLLEAIVLLSYPAGSITFNVAPGLLNVATSHRCHCCSMGGFGAPQPKAAAPKKPLNKKDFERQMNSYNALRIDGYPPPNVVDVYVHAPGKDKFWFVGKVAARAEATDDYGLAAVVQKRLVFEHAKLLQPREIGLSKTLEVRGLSKTLECMRTAVVSPPAVRASLTARVCFESRAPFGSYGARLPTRR